VHQARQLDHHRAGRSIGGRNSFPDLANGKARQQPVRLLLTADEMPMKRSIAARLPLGTTAPDHTGEEPGRKARSASRPTRVAG
jgi:hypothetical protein